MILLASVLVGLGLGFLRGGRWNRLTRLPFRWGLWAVVGLAAQLWIVQVPGEPGLGPRWWVMAASYALLLAVVWHNRQLPGMWLIGLGLLLNGAVILANGGGMPITPQMMERLGVPVEVTQQAMRVFVPRAKDIVLPREETRLWFLSDIGFLPILGGVAFSIGDVLIAGGVIWLLDAGLRGHSLTTG